jgi:DNA polymerase I-like protein with 3'-5' exonuclease and polymerase domains
MSDFDLDALLGNADPIPAKTQVTVSNETEDSLDDFMGGMDLKVEREVPDITKPWMKHHKFVRVESIKQLNDLIDEAIARGECSLDLETEGLDNRIYYRADGSPYTKHQIVGFCISTDGITGYYVPVRHVPKDGGANLNLPVKEAEEAITRLCQAAQPKGTPEALAEDPLSFKEVFKRKDATTGPGWLAPPQLVIYFWHAKFDQEFLYPVTGIDWWHPESFEDGNLAYYTYYSGDKNLGLKYKAKSELFDIEGNPHEMIEIKELFIQGRKEVLFASLSPDEPGCVKYACSDAINTFLLCRSPRPHEKRLDVMKIVKSTYNFTYRLEKQVAQACRWMERPRVRVNKAKIQAMRDANVVKRDALAKLISEIAEKANFFGFEPSSSKQLSEFLFSSDKGLQITLPFTDDPDWPEGKPPLNEKSGQYKTDADTLEQLVEAHPSPPQILSLIVEWRKLEKLDGTYLQNMVDNIDEHGEMRFQFKQTGAATGRFSAPAGDPSQGYSGIPIHGIPGTSALREAFEARPGFFLSKSDYAGEELRIASNVSGEMVWIKEFLEGTGDLHTITAMAFFGKSKHDVTKEERKSAKIANFALIYGGGPAAIMRATGCDKLEARRRKQAFDKAVPTFAKWTAGQHKFVKEKNGIFTPFGRWISLPAPKLGLPPEEIRRQEAGRERLAGNAPIQGGAADIMKIIMVLLCKEMYKKGWLKQGNGDDSIRMLLTVHDEIVFEIRNDRGATALPKIVEIMASPGHMAGPPYSPKWRVPLVVEPLIGLDWSAKYNYDMIMHGIPFDPGYKLTDIDIVIGDRIYHKVPAWLEGTFDLPYNSKGTEPGSDSPEVLREKPSLLTTPIAPRTESLSTVLSLQTEYVATPTPPPGVQSPSMLNIEGNVFVVKLNLLNRHTVRQVRSALMLASDPDFGKIVCIIDAIYGTEIVPPTLKIRVIPDLLVRALKDLNLSDGSTYPYTRGPS